MTEAEWLEFTYPGTLLDFLRLKAGKRDRKLRLFACGLVRRFMWPFLADERIRKAVEMSERFGDGVATLKELETARQAARAVVRGMDKKGKTEPVPREARGAAGLAAMVAVTKGSEAAQIWAAASQFARGGLDAPEETRERVNRQFCELLRCLFGPLPFRSVTIDSSWHTEKVGQLAQHIYEERKFEDIPILSDALIDAGCTNQEIIDHCRSKEPHCRGCWVVDLLLAKE